MRGLKHFLALLIMFAAIGAPAQAEEKFNQRITLVLICDIYNMSPNRAGRGGMAKIATAINNERKKGHPVIVAHAGDAISPSLMSGLDKGAHMIDLINMLGIDIFVPGNHEFDFGDKVFIKRMAEAKFPVFAANLADENGKPIKGIQSHRVIEAGKVRLGIVGLTAEDSVSRSSPEKLTFTSSPRTLYRTGLQLRKQGADIVVAVAHANRELDKALIAEKAADVILSGDDHDLQVRFDGKRAFVEAMEEGYYVLAVDLDMSVRIRDGKRKVRWWPNFRLIDTRSLQPDKKVAARVAVYESQLSKELDIPLGKTETPFDSNNATVRGGEAVIGNLYADAVRTMTGADVTLLNGGGFRAKKTYAAGSNITRRDVLAELPFSNKTFVLEIKGTDLLAALEQGFSKAHNLTGAFPQVSGMTIRADVSKPAGQRVVSVKIGDTALDPNKTYSLATNDFLARGGDGYGALKKAKLVVGDADGKLIANHVMAYIKKQKTVSPKLEGRIFVGRAASPQ